MTLATLSSHSNTVWDLAWDPTGKVEDKSRMMMIVVTILLSLSMVTFPGDRLASCSEDSSVRIWRRLAPGNKEGVPVPTESKEAWRCEATIQVLASKLFSRSVITSYIQGHHARAVYSVDWGEAGLVTGGGDDAIR